MFKDEHERIYEYLNKNTSRETDKASFKDALCNERYRNGTLITMTFAVAMFVNGIYPITS